MSLSPAERGVLSKVLSLDVRSVQRRTVLQEVGSTAAKQAVMLAGWACRFKRLPDGRRQVVAFYLPGDICDFSIFMAPELDSTIELIEGARVAGISQAQLATLSRGHPRIMQGFWRESQTAASIQREWLVNNSQRSARERVAHILCEIATRLRAVGLVDGQECDCPIMQADLGDACGMTAEHTNRTLRQLRDGGLATWRNGLLRIDDSDGLQNLCGFDPAYLQFRPAPQQSGDIFFGVGR